MNKLQTAKSALVQKRKQIAMLTSEHKKVRYSIGCVEHDRFLLLEKVRQLEDAMLGSASLELEQVKQLEQELDGGVKSKLIAGLHEYRQACDEFDVKMGKTDSSPDHGKHRQKQYHSRKVVENRVRTVKAIERDPADGSFTLPIKYGSIKVMSLGHVEVIDAFQSERYIYPVDYRVIRTYYSTVSKDLDSVEYDCSIKMIDGGIEFHITSLETGESWSSKSSKLRLCAFASTGFQRFRIVSTSIHILPHISDLINKHFITLIR